MWPENELTLPMYDEKIRIIFRRLKEKELSRYQVGEMEFMEGVVSSDRSREV
jgi:hypothetical protein